MCTLLIVYAVEKFDADFISLMATETTMSHDGDFAPSRWPSFHLIQDCLN